MSIFKLHAYAPGDRVKTKQPVGKMALNKIGRHQPGAEGVIESVLLAGRAAVVIFDGSTHRFQMETIDLEPVVEVDSEGAPKVKAGSDRFWRKPAS
jgi:uncharacterized protein (UPF0216 family)